MQHERPNARSTASRGTAVSAVLCTCLAIAGCGGASKPTKASYIAQGDTICKRAQAKLKSASRLNAVKDKSEIKARLAGLLEQGAGIVQSKGAEIRALQVPAGDSETIGKMLASLDGEAASLRATASAVAGGHPSGVVAGQAATQRARLSYSRIAKGYGFKVCGTAD